jgi:hypothetical protein
MASKKPASYSAAKFDAHLATKLERLSRTIGASVDDKAVDRILATVNFAGTSGVLAAGVEAVKLDPATGAEIKRMRWGGEVRSILGLLTVMVRRRKLSTPRNRKKLNTAAKALNEAKIMLRSDPAYEAALALAEMSLERVQDNMQDARAWNNERIAGEFLPQQYWTFTKRPKKTRKSMATGIAETVAFVQAVMRELEIIPYSEESIIRAMQDAKKPKRYR